MEYDEHCVAHELEQSSDLYFEIVFQRTTNSLQSLLQTKV